MWTRSDCKILDKVYDTDRISLLTRSQTMGCFFTFAVLFSCPLCATVENHTLQYFYTATSGISNISEFISVGILDGAEISYYDSNLTRSVPKLDWMKQLDQEYWDSETALSKMYDEIFRVDLDILGRRFNHAEGVHVLQKQYGCTWDDDTGATDGHEGFGYDGEDFLTLDLKNMRWIAPVPQALPSKLKWDSTEFFGNRKTYFNQTCIEWLKKYLAYGSSTLGRKVPPEVSVLQKDSSSLVCHATGFYPKAVMITWKRDGVEMQEDVDVGETLPNPDGTFQKRAVLTVLPDEWKDGQYTCEVAHQSGEPIVKTLTMLSNALQQWDKCVSQTEPRVKMFFVSMYVLIFAAGVILNFKVLVVIFCHARKRSLFTNYLIILAFADLSLVCTLPVWICYYLGVWLPHRLCEVMLLINMYFSIFLLSCISIDRFLAVCYPVNYYGVRKRSWVIFLGICIMTIGTCSPMYFKSRDDQIQTQYFGSFPVHGSRPTAIISLTLGFCIPQLAILVSSSGQIRKFTGKNGLFFRMIKIAMCPIIFLCCFLPYHLSLLLIYQHQRSIPCRLIFSYQYSQMMICFRVILDPLAFNFRFQNFCKKNEHDTQKVRMRRILVKGGEV